ncbi:MAG TPA: exonuclease subunit SbcD [Gemmataceae bacterium]|nr:exonuclease subunit SbcD [Gemmataceae bacterium]
MRLLHTGDWHLGDWLGRQNRTVHLRRSVERIAGYCDEQQIDVLLVAGDLFSDKCQRQDDLSSTVEHLSRTFGPFLRRGGTILAVTGNHDKEIPCQTLKHTLTLASPTPLKAGDLVPPGRLYLANRPTFLRLKDLENQEVQFVLLPYPTPANYLDDGETIRVTREEKNRFLGSKLVSRLQQMRESGAYRKDLHTVLMAHIHVHGANRHTLFQMTEEQDVILKPGDLPGAYAYVALGHIHKAQALGEEHIRYCGSIDRLNMDEREYSPHVVFFEIGPNGRQAEICELKLEAASLYDVVIDNPAEEILHLASRYPDAETALVKYQLTYEAGQDRNEFLRQLDEIFPHWFDRKLIERGTDRAVTQHASLPAQALTPDQTARHFVEKELEPSADRDDILKLLDEALAQVK